MKAWRWFVGQVARLRRSVADAVAPGAERAGENAASADEPAGGPPAHWVERVRQGAPGLLEPSLRRRGEPTRPPAERAVPSQAELEPRTRPLEEPDRGSMPPEPLVGPRQPEAKATARPRLLQRVLRRERSVPPANAESSASTADDDSSPAPTPDRIQRELQAATRRAGETEGSRTREPPERRRQKTPEAPAGKPTDRRRPVEESEPPPVRRSVPTTDLAERSPRRSEVLEFEAPAQRQAAQVEPVERPVRPTRADVARPAATSSQAELVVGEVDPDRLWEPAVPSPAPKRESNVEWLRDPAVPTSQREPAAQLDPAPRRRAEPLAAIEKHPWPELPPPIDEVDSDVEAALRAWQHQQRIDHEQTRL